VSVAETTVYTATARVTLGQPTSVQGSAVQTPFTNPLTAAGALDITGLSDDVAHALGVPRSTVRGHVGVAAITGVAVRTPGPPVLEVTASNTHRAGHPLTPPGIRASLSHGVRSRSVGA